MKYIVIQGRMPQNGDKAKTARILFPDWLSPTLVCAGIIGRVQELTDGNILEGGKVEEPLTRYAEIIGRGVLEDDIGEWVRYEDHVLLMTALRESPPDDAYREGMQAARNMFTETLKEHGFNSAGRGMKEWLVAELEELAQFRKDRPETLARLQAAEDERDALHLSALRNTDTRTPTGPGFVVVGGDNKVLYPKQGVMCLDNDPSRPLHLNETGAAHLAEHLQQHDPLRLQEFGTLEEAQAAHDALADKYDEMHEMLIQRTTQRDALYATALNNLNTLRDK